MQHMQLFISIIKCTHLCQSNNFHLQASLGNGEDHLVHADYPLPFKVSTCILITLKSFYNKTLVRYNLFKYFMTLSCLLPIVFSLCCILFVVGSSDFVNRADLHKIFDTTHGSAGQASSGGAETAYSK